MYNSGYWGQQFVYWKLYYMLKMDVLLSKMLFLNVWWYFMWDYLLLCNCLLYTGMWLIIKVLLNTKLHYVAWGNNTSWMNWGIQNMIVSVTPEDGSNVAVNLKVSISSPNLVYTRSNALKTQPRFLYVVILVTCCRLT